MRVHSPGDDPSERRQRWETGVRSTSGRRMRRGFGIHQNRRNCFTGQRHRQGWTGKSKFETCVFNGHRSTWKWYVGAIWKHIQTRHTELLYAFIYYILVNNNNTGNWRSQQVNLESYLRRDNRHGAIILYIRYLYVGAVGHVLVNWGLQCLLYQWSQIMWRLKGLKIMCIHFVSNSNIRCGDPCRQSGACSNKIFSARKGRKLLTDIAGSWSGFPYT